MDLVKVKWLNNPDEEIQSVSIARPQKIDRYKFVNLLKKNLVNLQN